MNARKMEKKNKRQLRIAFCFILVLGWSQSLTEIAKAQECPDPAPQTRAPIYSAVLVKPLRSRLLLETVRRLR